MSPRSLFCLQVVGPSTESTTRRRFFDERTRRSKVVQCGQGLWVHPALRRRGCVCTFFRDSGGGLSVLGGRRDRRIQGQTRPQGFASRGGRGRLAATGLREAPRKPVPDRRRFI